MKTKTKNKHPYVVMGILSVLLVITVLQSFQISTLASEIRAIRATGNIAGTPSPASGADGDTSLQQILKEITPTGTPDYGGKAGVSYDKVEESLSKLAGYATLSLSPEEQQRYDTIANTKGTPCKYCCGATKLAQNCGCSHNVALQGLTKWLIKNSDYSNDDILKEIHKWQVLFFPKPTLQEALQKRKISPGSVGLPSMVGGC